MDLYSVDIPFVDVPANDRIAFVLLIVFLFWALMAMFAQQMIRNEQPHASAPRKRYGKWFVRFFAPFIIMAKLFATAPNSPRPNDRPLTR